MPRKNALGIAGLTRDGARYVFRYRYRDHDGKSVTYKRRLPAGTPAEAAKAWARKTIGEIQAGTFVPPAEQRERETTEREARKPLSEVCTAYLEKLRADGLEKAAHDRAYHCGKLRAVLGDDVALDEVNALVLARLKKTIREGGVSNSTINRHLATLKHLVRFANRAGWATAATLELVRSEKLLKEPPGRLRELSADERERLRNTLDTMAASGSVTDLRARMFVLVAWLSGMRQGEVRTLRRAQVDLARHEIRLTKTKTNRTRIVRLPDVLVEALRVYLERFGEDVLFPGRDELGAAPGSTPLSVPGATKAWLRVRGAAELGDFHYHDLRHDFATQVRRRGVGLDHIAKLLGHSTLQMSARYAHVGEDELRGDVFDLTTEGAGKARLGPTPGPTKSASSTAQDAGKSAVGATAGATVLPLRRKRGA